MMQRVLDVHHVLFSMEIKDQILFILKEAKKPLKAREISRRFMLHFNELISKKDVNRTIYSELKSKVVSLGFPTYKFSLIEKIKNNSPSESANTIISEQKNIDFDQSSNVYKLIDEYIVDFHKFRATKDNSIRDNCLSKLDEIIENIISNKLSLNEISTYLEKEILIHKQIFGDKRIIEFYKIFQIENDKNSINSSALNYDLLKLIQQYESIYSDYTKLNRKPENIKATFKYLINEFEKKSQDILEFIIDNILENEVSLSCLESECSSNLYIKIENHERIYDWIFKKEKFHLIEKDSYDDKLKEFKILCLKVWEDGVVDDNEQKEIDEKIINLGLINKDAQQIFNEIKQDYKIQKSLEDSEDGVFIKKVKNPKRPLEYFYKGSSQEILIDEDLTKDKLILAICELDLNFQNQKILKKINRIIENELQ